MSQELSPHFRLESINRITVVHFLDQKIVTEANDQLSALVEKDEHRRLLLNFSHLKVLSSVAIAKLVSLQQKVSGYQGMLKVCCVNPNLLELLQYVGLDRYIEIYGSQDEALRAF
jgi:anti-sigma B factor antagonist